MVQLGKTANLFQNINSFISTKVMMQTIVFFRIISEILLYLAGLFRIKPVFQSRQRGKKRIAFQAYSRHLAQFYLTIIRELLKDSDRFEVIFIILPHPQFPFHSALDICCTTL